ncbi:MAG: molybdopterin-guanine dinucleotide biosynthesis protein B [Desulfobulbus sp.]|jgi:molybdopterin-guanine dinucleotide biosynthesis protein B|nr:molybdopterin-guanine dinucleotide biosynthesis protein B [Desulfobulbus sp.]
MPFVVCFIGWHNSGKTTLVSRVVALLKARGHRVAVIKSTKEQGLLGEPPQADTALHRRAGADAVALVAPDQFLLRTAPPTEDLMSLVLRYFNDMDFVLAEGFKRATKVMKIEVRRDAQAPLLCEQVANVVGVVTDQAVDKGLVFAVDDIAALVDWIEAQRAVSPEARHG